METKTCQWTHKGCSRPDGKCHHCDIMLDGQMRELYPNDAKKRIAQYQMMTPIYDLDIQKELAEMEMSR